MARFASALIEPAQADVRDSYDWGRRTWGKHEAQLWVRQLRTSPAARILLTTNMSRFYTPVDYQQETTLQWERTSKKFCLEPST
jgi:plasmid stabilization system protein ParE